MNKIKSFKFNMFIDVLTQNEFVGGIMLTKVTKFSYNGSLYSHTGTENCPGFSLLNGILGNLLI